MMDNVQFQVGDFLSSALLPSSGCLIEKVWPGYLPLFQGEVKAFQASRDIFTPYFVVATLQEEVCGFAVLAASMMSDSLNAISWLAVDENCRRQNIGSRLLSACLLEAKRRNKDVILTTTIPDFYRKHGFEVLCQLNNGTNFVMKLDIRTSVVKD